MYSLLRLFCVCLFIICLWLSRKGLLFQESSSSGSSSSRVNSISSSYNGDADVDIRDEKFITFLPHSGLHNQRIALINAILLAKTLNRTLLMPEINIGRAIAWRPFTALSQLMDECSINVNNDENLSCKDYEHYIPVPIEFIFDISAAKKLGVKVEQRTDMRKDYIQRHHISLNHKYNPFYYYNNYFFNNFNNNNNHHDRLTYKVHDRNRYDYRIHDIGNFISDDYNDDKENQKYTSHIKLETLLERKEAYVEFGSLYSSSRLALHRPEYIWAKGYLNREIGTNHPIVDRYSQQIVDELGGPNQYISIHIRQGDGIFKKTVINTMRKIESMLKRTIRMVHSEEHQDIFRHDHDSQEMLVESIIQEQDKMNKLKGCLAIRDRHIPELSVIFMATDGENPRNKMKSLFERYPCTFTLEDFLIELNDTINHLFFPLMDAEIASYAKVFIGTPKSTYSSYVRHRQEYHQQSLSLS